MEALTNVSQFEGAAAGAAAPRVAERISEQEWAQIVYARRQADAAQEAYARAVELAPALAVFNTLRDAIYARYGLGAADTITDGQITRAG